MIIVITGCSQAKSETLSFRPAPAKPTVSGSVKLRAVDGVIRLPVEAETTSGSGSGDKKWWRDGVS